MPFETRSTNAINYSNENAKIRETEKPIKYNYVKKKIISPKNYSLYSL